VCANVRVFFHVQWYAYVIYNEMNNAVANLRVVDGECVAVCCSVSQCVAVCCSVLQCVAVCCSVLQCVAVCCSVLQCVAVRCSELQCAVCCSVLQCVAVCHSVLQCVAVCCSVLQCVAVCMYHTIVCQQRAVGKKTQQRCIRETHITYACTFEKQ